MERIESAVNGKIRLAASLRQRKYREKLDMFPAEGVRLAEMAVASAWPLVMALVTVEAARRDRVQRVLEQLRERGCPVYEVSEPVYRKAASTVTPQGLFIVLRRRAASWAELTDVPASALWVVLDGVQDPGNAGSIVRTADAAGATGIIALTGTADLFSDKAIRASMGSIFHLPILENIAAAELVQFAQGNGVRLLATALDEAGQNHFAANYRPPVAVVFGQEGSGVSAAVLDAAEHIYIPMIGPAESLNVAAASAVILYEALRQRMSDRKGR